MVGLAKARTGKHASRDTSANQPKSVESSNPKNETKKPISFNGDC